MSKASAPPSESPLPSPSALADLPRDQLVHGATALVARAKATPNEASLAMLSALRRVLLLRNERHALALTLNAQGHLATELGQHSQAADAFDSEWGVRELLQQPFRAHRARLDHAEALFRAGATERAEAALRSAQPAARALAAGGNESEAAAALADTLARLSGLLFADGRHEEASLWLQGAAELAPDADCRARVDATPARFANRVPRTRSL